MHPAALLAAKGFLSRKERSMYRVLIVDDELPALRFVQNIIEKYALGYQIAGTCTSGEQALEFLAQESIDLLITDISMHGISGIELAKHVRSTQPSAHLLIISGFGEFEYAQGAIQAGVDDYILKPVSITKMTAVLQAIKEKLDMERVDVAASLLPGLACGQACDEAEVDRVYGHQDYRFALIRWGNLDMTLPSTLSATGLVYPPHDRFQVLRGRDEDERILIYTDDDPETFITDLSVYTTQPGRLSTWTAIYSGIAQPIRKLESFITQALAMLYRKTVIGKHQILQLVGGNVSEHRMKLPGTDLKQLGYFVSVGKTRMIKDYFISLAISWERGQIPQRQAWHMIRQLIHQIAAIHQPVYDRLDDILIEFNELIRFANSYSDLMSGTYSLIFDGGNVRDKKMSTKELYDYTVQYIEENYAHPLSMQSVCDEIGISQTYLSRLFRKYSDTTFNAYLTRCRMEAAKQLLLEKPDLLLRDVAACVGYEDSSYFTKVFHQYTGKTPSQYSEGKAGD